MGCWCFFIKPKLAKDGVSIYGPNVYILKDLCPIVDVTFFDQEYSIVKFEFKLDFMVVLTNIAAGL